MKPLHVHPPSLLAGCALTVLASLLLAQATPAPRTTWEYKIVDDPGESELRQLSDDGYEYAGYLGLGVRGVSNDQTLWRRARK